MKAIILFTFLTCLLFEVKGQECTFSMIALDRETGKPLEFVSVSFKHPHKKHWDMAYTNSNGEVLFSQEKDIQISYNFNYLGYREASLTIICNENTKSVYRILMDKKPFKLDEITITDKFPAIVEKKDTTIYNVDEFTSGKEEKLKEILNKLPGLHVDRDHVVTFQGKRVNEILVESDKFFTGDPGLASKYIPADAVDRVEILEKYNELNMLRNTDTNDKLALNIRLKKDKKRFFFGEAMAGTNASKRHVVHNNGFYYSPVITANNILDFNTTNDQALSFQEISRVMGIGQYHFDPKSRVRPDAMFNLMKMVSATNIYDKTSFLGLQHFRYRQQKIFSVDVLGMGYKTDQQSNYHSSMIYPISSNVAQTAASDVFNQTQQKFAYFSFSTNPENKYHISYQFRYRDNPGYQSEKSENTFLDQSNNLTLRSDSENSGAEHHLHWIQQWNKRVVTIHSYKHNSQNDTLRDLATYQGKFIPSIYGFSSDLTRIAAWKNTVQNTNYFLHRTNIMLNSGSNIYIFGRWYNHNYLNELLVKGLDIIPELPDLPLETINDLTSQFEIGSHEFLIGSRYHYTDLINEIQFGVDYLSWNHPYLKENNSIWSNGMIAPLLQLSRNIRNVGLISLNWQMDLITPTVHQMNPFLVTENQNRFSLGNILLEPSRKNAVGLGFEKRNSKKGLSLILNLMYSHLTNPVLSGFERIDDNLVERFNNSERPKNDYSLTMFFSKVQPLQKLFIHNRLVSSYSQYFTLLNHQISPFEQILVMNTTTINKEWKNTVLGSNFMANVRNIPVSGNSEWMMNYQISADFKQYFGKNWSFSVNQGFGSIISKQFRQISYPMNASINYKTSNEKFKVSLQGHNLLNQNTVGKSQVTPLVTTFSGYQLFPRYLYLSVSYIY